MEATEMRVVYQMTLPGSQGSRNAVCTQGEWDAMQHATPGRHALIEGRIGNEGQAEQMARRLQTPSEPPKATRRLPHTLKPQVSAGS